MALDTNSVRTWVMEQLVRDIQSYSLRLLLKLGIGLEHNGLEMRLIRWKCDL